MGGWNFFGPDFNKLPYLLPSQGDNNFIWQRCIKKLWILGQKPDQDTLLKGSFFVCMGLRLLNLLIIIVLFYLRVKIPMDEIKLLIEEVLNCLNNN